MIDTIAVHGIRAYGKHGADPGERDFVQPFEIDLEFGVDLSRARRTDALEATIDYAVVHARVIALVADRSYRLIERLGDEILGDLMRDARIVHASLTIRKPKRLAGATPSVRLTATRA